MTKISDLPPAGGLTGDEVAPIVQTASTRQVSLDTLVAFLNDNLPPQVDILSGLSGADLLLYLNASGVLSTSSLTPAARGLLNKSTVDAILQALAGAKGDADGVALKAMVLNTARNINGVAFSGAGNILISGSRVAFSATTNPATAQTIPSATLYKILFQTELTDVGAGFDLPNSRFVAPVAGNYAIQFGAAMTTTATTDTLGSQLWKNGARIQNGSLASSPVSGSGVNSTGSVVLPLAANDFLEVFAFSAGAGTRVANVNVGNCYLSGHLL